MFPRLRCYFTKHSFKIPVHPYKIRYFGEDVSGQDIQDFNKNNSRELRSIKATILEECVCTRCGYSIQTDIQYSVLMDMVTSEILTGTFVAPHLAS